jgi:hypothetical protein
MANEKKASSSKIQEAVGCVRTSIPPAVSITDFASKYLSLT